MQTFAVISSVPSHPELESAVRTVYAHAFKGVAANVWLVADKDVVARDVALKLGVKSGETAGMDNVVVLQFGSYWGHAPGLIWTWIEQQRLAG